MEFFARIRAFMRAIEIACGVLLVGIGVLIMQGKLDFILPDSVM